MPFSMIVVKLRLIMPKTNKKKRQNRRSEKFTHQFHFLKSCCKLIYAMLLAQIILHQKLILRQQFTDIKKRIFWHVLIEL